MTMITPSYLGETIEYSSLHACRSTLEDPTDQVSEGIIAAGCRASEVIGVRLAGIDIITPDVRRGLEEAGGKIIEVNTTPGFHYHYFKQGGASRVAVPILKACLEHARGCC